MARTNSDAMPTFVRGAERAAWPLPKNSTAEQFSPTDFMVKRRILWSWAALWAKPASSPTLVAPSLWLERGLCGHAAFSGQSCPGLFIRTIGISSGRGYSAKPIRREFERRAERGEVRWLD